MGRTRIAQALIRDLKEKKENSSKRKNELIDYLKRLNQAHFNEKLSGAEYVETLHKKNDGRNIKEWVDYYENYSKDCEKEIKKQNKEIIKRKAPVFLFSILLIAFFVYLFISTSFFSLNLTGLFVGEQREQQFSQNINLTLDKSTIYNLQLENSGQLTSLKINGLIKGDGEVKVYLENLLILDSSSTENKNSKLTGKVIEENPISGPFEETNNSYSDKEAPSKEESSPSQGELLTENQPQTNSSNQSYSEEQTQPSHPGSEATNESEALPKEESSPSQEEPQPSEQNTTNIQNKNETITLIRKFTEVCTETCDLTSLNLNESAYKLRIEVTNAKLQLDTIDYTLLPLEIIPETNITTENITINTTQYKAVLGQPVKWKKKILLNESGPTIVELPKEAENIVVNKIIESYSDKEAPSKEESSPSQGELLTENNSKKERAKADIKTKIKPYNKTPKKNSRITGNAIVDTDSSPSNNPQEIIQVTINDNATDYEIEYETPAPYAIETNLIHGKEVKIVGSEEIHYENVLSFTNLSENLKISNPSQIKIYWVENKTYIPLDSVQDTNLDGIYDYVEWTAPHLSNQTFDIIVITKAEHLNSNREFISNIYEQVRDLDNVWSETISTNDYVRITFEINLTNTNDITIYPRILSGNPTIEVYEKDGTTKIAEFTNLNSNEYNKIYLINLKGRQDTFDLRVKGGSVEFDHIIDPPPNTWEVNLTINASLPNIGSYSSPSVFYKDSTWYMIAGNGDGYFDGFAWNGTQWKTNTTINASLPLTNDAALPTVFYKDSSWYIIWGQYDGSFYGYTWDGTQWATNSTIINSLPSLGYGTWTTPNVFYKDSSWYLISGNSLGNFYGYAWDGTQWVTNLTINASLPNIGTYSEPSVFFKDSSWYLISGESNGNFYGYAWDGTQWVTNLTINASLPNIGSYSSPSVFYKDGKWYLISGTIDGNFYSYDYYQPNYALQIINPTTANTLSVTSGNNYSIYFNFSDTGANVTSGVSIDSVFIGGTNATIVITPASSPSNNSYSTTTINNKSTDASLAFPAAFNTGWDTGNASQACYTAVSASDNSNCTMKYVSGTNADLWMRMNFTIPEPINSIDSITITAIGGTNASTPASENLSFQIANWSNSQWEFFAASANARTVRTTTYTTTTQNLSNLIKNGQLVLQFIGYNFDTTGAESFFIDYVNVKVNSSNKTSQQFTYIPNVGWQVNVTAPTFASGLKDLFINATYSGNTRNNTQSNAINYGSTDSTPPTITFEEPPTPSNGSSAINPVPIVANISDQSNISSWIDLDRSLVGYWAMDYYNSTVMYDNSTYRNNGTFNGAFNYSNPAIGARGYGRRFNGVNDYLDAGTSSALTTPTVSISLWIKPETNNNKIFLSRGVYFSNGWYLWTDSADGLIVDLHSVGAMSELTVNSFFTIGEWQHIVVIINQTQVSYYKNGIPFASDPDDPTGIAWVAANEKLVIGGYSDLADPSYFYNGTLDEIMIFNRSLSQTEISALYNSTNNKFNTSSMNLSNGQHNYTVYAIDTYGNVNNSGWKYFNVTSGSSTPTFSATWNTSKNTTGTTNSSQIGLPLENGGQYNFNVDWGDTKTDTITAWNDAKINHTYTTPGVYTVNITGTIVGFGFHNLGDKSKITNINSWGPLNVGNNGGYFYGCSNLNSTATDNLNLTGTTDFSNMFSQDNIFNGNISGWNTSNVIIMNSMFASAQAFNQDISGWDTGKVTSMTGMFWGAATFNQNLSNWNTSSVTSMNIMFDGAYSFNGNISNWDTSKVTDMSYMFQNSQAFNQNLSNWNTSKVTDMNHMFNGATVFNGNISNWDTSKVTTMQQMFNTAQSFNQNISGWNTGKVTNMNDMFTDAEVFNQSIGNWNTSSVGSMNYMFMYAYAFNQNLSSWNVSNLSNAMSMFDGIALSTPNYDSLLIGWASRTPVLKNNTVFSGGNSKYSAAGLAGRNILTGTYNWTITDGGLFGSDTTPPTYTQVSVNNTIAGMSTNFSINVTDNTALHPNGGYIFSTNNTWGNTTWKNDSFVLFTITPSWANVTKVLNSTAGTWIGYRWYFNDSANNTNSTPIYTTNTTSAVTCATPLSSAGTTYTLTSNVSSTGTCFTIAANNITLDCNGYWINYSTNGNDGNFGVYALNQFNVTIKNCNIFDANRTTGYWSSNGIYLSGTTNSTIFNNFVNGSNSRGIYIDSSSNYNNLTSNTGTTSGSSQGIRLDHASNYNTLINNTAMSGSNEATALTGNSSFNIIINHTTISPSGRGVYLWQAANHNTFINTNTSGDIGFRFDNASDNRIVDCTSISGTSYDVYYDNIAGNYNNTFVNCSYNINKETVQGTGSQLIRKWYYQAYVNYTNGSAASNANVTASNGTGKIQFTILTDSSGFITKQEIIDYNNTGTRVFYSNYTITTNKSGYTNSSKTYNLTVQQNKVDDYFTLTGGADSTPPTYSQNSTNNTIAGQMTLFSININDETALHPNGQYIFSTNNSGTWLNYSIFGVGNYWQKDLGTNASLPNVGSYSSPTIFYKDSSWYLISGNSNGGFAGYAWNGTNWKVNTTINSSLFNDTNGCISTTFYKDSSWYFLSGNWDGSFYGYAWNGTQWLTNLTINSSLPSLGYGFVSAPTVFYKDSSWYLISGNASGRFYGFTWNGTDWKVNLTINTSLPDIGSYSTPSVFYKDKNLYLISGSGNGDGNFYGYAWNGTDWKVNLTINASLPNVDDFSVPSFFNKDGIWNVIIGGWSGGFHAYNYSSSYNFTSTPSWANVTTTLNSTMGTGVGYKWYFDDNASNTNSTQIYTLTTTSTNAVAPVIYNVTSISPITLTEGPGKTFIVVNFSVYDFNGAANLNNASAAINFTKAGEDLRYNSSCAVKNFAGSYANYSCNVTMFWWDAAGSDWKVYANISDLDSYIAVNDTMTFTVNTLTGFVMSPSALTFSSLSAGSVNQTPTNYLTLNNTGNTNITNPIQINSTDLVGETDHSKILWASNFSASNSTGGKIECNITASATSMLNNTFVSIGNTLLSVGNYTKNDGTAQEQIYLCARKVGIELTQQQYSTNAFGSWTVRIVLVSISVRRKRKKNSKNSTNITIPSTIFSKELGALETISKYMKENLGISYHNIAELLNRDERTIWTAYNKALEKQNKPIEVKETEIFIPISVLNNRELTVLESVINYLREKDMKYSEIAKLINRDQRNVRAIYTRIEKRLKNIVSAEFKPVIPTTIFSKELGALETISKYMKENLGISYHNIAELLNRDERTIWTAYNKALEKQNKPIEVKETKIFIPISVLNNRELTILESVINYLREKDMKYSEIAKLINRDQRNVRAIYNKTKNNI
jgi:surface protein